jgi:hypothetical protein
LEIKSVHLAWRERANPSFPVGLGDIRTTVAGDEDAGEASEAKNPGKTMGEVGRTWATI